MTRKLAIALKNYWCVTEVRPKHSLSLPSCFPIHIHLPHLPSLLHIAAVMHTRVLSSCVLTLNKGDCVVNGKKPALVKIQK